WQRKPIWRIQVRVYYCEPGRTSNDRPFISMRNLRFFVTGACIGLIACGSPARAAEPDALAILANVQARHLPYGAILDPIFTLTNSDQISSYTRCGDSALWTGHYLAAEAFRYKVTQAPDALSNIQTAISSLRSL